MDILDKYIELKNLSDDNIYLIDIVNYYKERLNKEIDDNNKLLIYLNLLLVDLNVLLKNDTHIVEHKNHMRQRIKEINILVKNIKSSNTIIKNNI